jgi:hypothetical protein
MATARAGPGLSDRIERNALRATFTGFPQSRPPRGPARARLVLPVLRPRATTDTATSPTLAYVAVNELRCSKETERDRRLWGGRHVSSTGRRTSRIDRASWPSIQGRVGPRDLRAVTETHVGERC